MVQDSPSRKMDQFIVRLPDGMRDRIKAAAEANNRSMNAEVVATLEEAYPPPPPAHEEALEETLTRFELIGLEIDRCLKGIEDAQDHAEIVALSDRFRGLNIVQKQIRNDLRQIIAGIKSGDDAGYGGDGNGDGTGGATDGGEFFRDPSLPPQNRNNS